MDFAAIEPALAAWLSTLSGIDPLLCVWENAPRPQGNGIVGYLSWLSTASTNVDDRQYQFDSDATDPLAEMVPGTRTDRVCTLQLAVDSWSQRPGQTARAVLEGFRDRLYSASSLAYLLDLNIAVVDDSAVTQADYRVDDRWISRSVCTVRLNVASFYVDPAGATASVTELVTTATIRDESGTSLPDPLQPGGTLP